jgi:glycosyltransferase involved in cell wall biosynthesis
MKKIMLLPGAFSSPSARLRIIQFYSYFVKAGHHVVIRVPYPDRTNRVRNSKNRFWHKMHPRLSQIARFFTALWMIRDVYKYDYVISNRDIVPDNIDLLERIILYAGVELIIDFDDAIFLSGRFKKINRLFKMSSFLVAGNSFLYEYAKKFNKNIRIIPTVTDTKLLVPSFNENKVVTIGWIGSKDTTIRHLPMLHKVFEKLVMEKDLNIRILIVSDYEPDFLLDLKPIVSFKPWSEEGEVRLLQEMDVGLMPLPENKFEQGKCGGKVVQYLAVGIPVLLSPVGANQTIITHGVEGFHCVTEDDWVNDTIYLAKNKSAREKMGKMARKKAVEFYSIDYALDQWMQIINRDKK